MRTFRYRTSGYWTVGLCLAFGSVALAQTSVQPARVITGVFPDSTNPPAAALVAPAKTDVATTVRTAPAPLAGGDSTVRLGTGDLVDVSVYNVPELDTKTRVSSTGDIYLPLVDYVHVDGLTVDEAESVIEKRLEKGEYVKNPHVQLFVQEYESAGANVMGEVSKPGIYPVLGEQTLLTVISAAGGFTDRAGTSVSITRRDQPGTPITVPISLNPEDHPDSNVPVHPADPILVRPPAIISLARPPVLPLRLAIPH